MKSIKIEFGKKRYKFQLPTVPEDLNEEQWLFLYKLQQLMVTGDELKLRFLTSCMKHLPVKLFNEFNDEQMLDLCKELEFLDTEFYPANCPISKLTKKFQKYLPPRSLDELTGAEYSIIESCFIDYTQLDDIFFMYKLLALLYRPVSLRGKRKDLDENTIDSHANMFQGHLGNEYVFLIADWYRSWHDQLEQDYPEVFNGEESKGKSEGFVEVIYSMAGPKLGQVDQVMKMDIKSILMAATLEILANKRIKAASKSK